MQRGLSRVVWNVYIAVSFHDEVLDSVKVVEPAEVSGGVHAWSLFISQQRVVVAIMNMLETHELHASIQHHMDSRCDKMYKNQCRVCML